MRFVLAWEESLVCMRDARVALREHLVLSARMALRMILALYIHPSLAELNGLYGLFLSAPNRAI